MATTAEYLNKLVTQKNTLADNLVTKGVAASHDETLETLVPKILEISGGSDKYYIYNNGQELNGNTLNVYHKSSLSGKQSAWVYMYYYYGGVIASSMLSLRGYKRIGVSVMLNDTNNYTPFYTWLSIRDSDTVELSGNDYLAKGNIIGEKLTPIDNSVDSTVTTAGGIFYIDIPKGIDNGYLVINSVNVDVYLLGVWLE